MYGMKINFEKSEVFSVGLSDADRSLAVDILGCKSGSFPMKYLGTPVSTYKISKLQLSYVCEKTEKRSGTWQCDYVSSG